MTKIAIIGAGTQAKAVLDYFLRFTDFEIGVFDKDVKATEKLKNFAQLSSNDSRVLTSSGFDITSDYFVKWLSYYDAAISCVPYFLNETLTKQSIKAKTHFTDLGGNNDIVKAQLAMSEEAKQAGILVVPDLGLAPGMAGLLAADLVRSLPKDGRRQVNIYVGGLPVAPKEPFNYALSFSVHGLINEYLEDCDSIRDSKKITVKGLSEVFSFSTPDLAYNNHKYESFNTSGGISTLTDTLLGEVDWLNYQTIRYAGHCNVISALRDLGYFEPDRIEDTKKRLENILPKNQKDMIIMDIVAELSGKLMKSVSMIDYGDHDRGISAMARCTGYPAAIITAMIARGEVAYTGTIPQENCINVARFKELVEECGIKLKCKNWA